MSLANNVLGAKSRYRSLSAFFLLHQYYMRKNVYETLIKNYNTRIASTAAKNRELKAKFYAANKRFQVAHRAFERTADPVIKNALTKQKRNAEREMNIILNNIYDMNRKLENHEQEIFNGFRSGRPRVYIPPPSKTPMRRWI
jgi:hypothetical protein